jgi:signal peptidase I
MFLRQNQLLLFGSILFIILVSLIILFVQERNNDGNSVYEKNNMSTESEKGDFSCTKQEQKTVQGESMFPLLSSGEVVDVFMKYYDCNTPKRGDIVLIDYAGNTNPLIKSIQGIPGDAYELIEDGSSFHIRLNGDILKNSQGVQYTLSRTEIQEIAKYAKAYGPAIPSSRYLILGDNPSGSLDSTRFGFMSENTLIARAFKK